MDDFDRSMKDAAHKMVRAKLKAMRKEADNKNLAIPPERWERWHDHWRVVIEGGWDPAMTKVLAFCRQPTAECLQHLSGQQ